jgi:hypothetical protein
MPIKFACSCGTQLRVADKDAGRRVKCPKCGDTVTSPSGTEDDDERPARRRDDDDGIQESPRRRSAAVDDDRPSRRGRDRDEDDRDDDRIDEEEESKPRKKKRQRKEKKSALPLILAIVLGVVLVLGGGGFGVVWFFFMRTPNVSDMAYVPADAQGVVMFRPADTWKLDVWKKLTNSMRFMIQGGEDPVNQIERQLSLELTEIERLWIVVQDIDQPNPTHWTVVRTLKPYDRKAILARLANQKEVKHEGKTFYLGNFPTPGIPGPPPGMGGPGGPPPGMRGGANEESAVYPAGSHVIIYSNDVGMRRCLTDAAKKKTTGPLASAIQQADGKHNFVSAFTLTAAAQKKIKDGAVMVPAQAKGFLNMLDMTAVTAVIDGNSSSVDIETALTYPDADKAGKAKKSFDGLRALAELGLPTLEEQIKQFRPPDEAAKSIATLKAVVDSLKADVSGNDLKIQVKLDNKAIEDLLPGPGAGGAPPGGFRPGPPGKGKR